MRIKKFRNINWRFKEVHIIHIVIVSLGFYTPNLSNHLDALPGVHIE